MPLERKEVESYLANQERITKEEQEKFLPTVAPIKTEVLKTLTDDPEHLYSIVELAEHFWTLLPQPMPNETQKAYETLVISIPPKDAEHPIITEEDKGRLQTALQILVEEKEIVYYPDPQNPRMPYFGIAKKELPPHEDTEPDCGCNGACKRGSC